MTERQAMLMRVKGSVRYVERHRRPLPRWPLVSAAVLMAGVAVAVILLLGR